MDRRIFLAGLGLGLSAPSMAQAANFSVFLRKLRNVAEAHGVPASVAMAATRHLHPNAKVLRLDRHQAEFTETWARYSSQRLTQDRIVAGQDAYSAHAGILAHIRVRYGVEAAPILGIWGLETNYGQFQGGFNVLQALATLAWSRNSSFFMGEAVAALRIIASGDAPLETLRGSYAGAMGQPQFMPSVYLSTSVSYSGAGAPDIWESDADSLASIANYLRVKGWQAGLPAAEPVFAPGVDPSLGVQSLAYWRSAGVQRLVQAPQLPPSTQAALLREDDDAYLVYANFAVIRAYNPSDFYALEVNALGRLVTTA